MDKRAGALIARTHAFPSWEDPIANVDESPHGHEDDDFGDEDPDNEHRHLCIGFGGIKETVHYLNKMLVEEQLRRKMRTPDVVYSVDDIIQGKIECHDDYTEEQVSPV
jgi:hypothetical protein